MNPAGLLEWPERSKGVPRTPVLPRFWLHRTPFEGRSLCAELWRADNGYVFDSPGPLSHAPPSNVRLRHAGDQGGEEVAPQTLPWRKTLDELRLLHRPIVGIAARRPPVFRGHRGVQRMDPAPQAALASPHST